MDTEMRASANAAGPNVFGSQRSAGLCSVRPGRAWPVDGLAWWGAFGLAMPRRDGWMVGRCVGARCWARAIADITRSSLWMGPISALRDAGVFWAKSFCGVQFRMVCAGLLIACLLFKCCAGTKAAEKQ